MARPQRQAARRIVADHVVEEQIVHSMRVIERVSAAKAGPGLPLCLGCYSEWSYGRSISHPTGSRRAPCPPTSIAAANARSSSNGLNHWRITGTADPNARSARAGKSTRYLLRSLRRRLARPDRGLYRQAFQPARLDVSLDGAA
jgi:hypothetical protein